VETKGNGGTQRRVLPMLKKNITTELVGPEAYMRRLGYKSRKGFFDFVRSSGVPHIRLNPRRIIFDPVQVEAWLQSRVVGKVFNTPPES